MKNSARLNHQAAGKAGTALLFAIVRHRPVVILMLALVGCGRRAVLAEPVRVMNQVHEWIPSGTPIAEAEKILDAHQFSWTMVTNRSLADFANGTLLVCHPLVANTQAVAAAPQRWSIVLVITNGDVSSVHLTEALKDL